MGGDGGVIASSRKFMRGAGTADCVGDLHKHAAAQKFNAKEAMTTCALTKTPLYTNTNNSNSSTTSTIVADPYGSLYHKEAAVRALLKRKQQGHDDSNNCSSFNENTNNTEAIGPQVRRLADLYEVRFHRDEPTATPTCPISGKALNGIIAAIVLVPGKEGMPNVVSESILSRLNPEELEAEFGAVGKKVRLAPNTSVLLEQIKEEVARDQEREEEERRRAKRDKKNKRKRGAGAKGKRSSEKKKKSDDGGTKSSNIDRNKKTETAPPRLITSKPSTSSSSSSLGNQLQSRVDSAIQQNSVLSSLFTSKSASSKISEKEKKDNLFARWKERKDGSQAINEKENERYYSQ